MWHNSKATVTVIAREFTVYTQKTEMPTTAATAPRALKQQCRGQQLRATGTKMTTQVERNP